MYIHTRIYIYTYIRATTRAISHALLHRSPTISAVDVFRASLASKQRGVPRSCPRDITPSPLEGSPTINAGVAPLGGDLDNRTSRRRSSLASIKNYVFCVPRYCKRYERYMIYIYIYI